MGIGICLEPTSNRMYVHTKNIISFAHDSRQMHCDSPHMHKSPWNVQVFLHSSFKTPPGNAALPQWHEPTHNSSQRHTKASAVTTGNKWKSWQFWVFRGNNRLHTGRSCTKNPIQPGKRYRFTQRNRNINQLSVSSLILIAHYITVAGWSDLQSGANQY